MAKKKGRKKKGASPAQTTEEKVAKLLGLGEETSPYFTIEIEKDPHAWLGEFRDFLSEATSALEWVDSIDLEAARESEIQRKARDLLSNPYVIFMGFSPSLKHIRNFLFEVNGLHNQVKESSALFSVLPKLREALTVLTLIFLKGYDWLYDMMEAEYLEDQIAATTVFAKNLRVHRVCSRLEELKIGMGFPAFFGSRDGDRLMLLQEFLKNHVRDAPDRLHAEKQSYPPGQLADALNVSTTTLNKYAKEAGVARPGRLTKKRRHLRGIPGRN